MPDTEDNWEEDLLDDDEDWTAEFGDEACLTCEHAIYWTENGQPMLDCRLGCIANRIDDLSYPAKGECASHRPEPHGPRG